MSADAYVYIDACCDLIIAFTIIQIKYRAGHHIGQENKACILDLIDALCCPSEEYYGVRYVMIQC